MNASSRAVKLPVVVGIARCTRMQENVLRITGALIYQNSFVFRAISNYSLNVLIYQACLGFVCASVANGPKGGRAASGASVIVVAETERKDGSWCCGAIQRGLA
jgi:hypothetical protein